MVWVSVEAPIIPSLEKYGSEKARIFIDTCITHLIMHREGWIGKKMEELGIKSPREAVEFVINNIDYPSTLETPDDKHVWEAFSGKIKYVVFKDYWSSASEVLMTYILNKKLYGKPGYGDFEDTSILATSMLRILNTPAYEVFGAIYSNNTLLGGHAWTIAKLEDGKWHLIETFLTQPPKYPSNYPVINPEENKWRIRNTIYEGWIKFNEKEYYEWREPGTQYSLEKYLAFEKKDKYNMRKYEALEKAWRIKTKVKI
ncbi:transglutaminase-like domain-containing protein [Staphylothermus hellenicus]|uniref:Transglutaminase-like domain-containing protein n=1 Tax=Staphylothermus hellenicus (strain DSM 12710 / JCM 10830 / BK20S6-10-b1 / P8) TaxID=591019 RepID=D7DAR5_STAHD|nr:transglutaminase-like domain-containing protein [Staphylothermus hellenicus]ADI31262.1 hypothetical protein Shell_0116 [Staphylothermus hellenicus DSM 12710]